MSQNFREAQFHEQTGFRTKYVKLSQFSDIKWAAWDGTEFINETVKEHFMNKKGIVCLCVNPTGDSFINTQYKIA
jgi:hypothetical protein